MRKTKILVVEDDSILSEMLQERLQGLGYEVPGVVTTGEEAIAKAGELTPDLILMDIRLKGTMDGIGAAQKIRDRYDLPIIYLTAHGDEETFDRAKGTGPQNYLLKPVNDKDLQVSIEMALFRHRLEMDLKDRIKELNCQYALSELVAKPHTSSEAVLAGIVDLIPPAWEYPEITYARLVITGREFKTGNYVFTPWSMVTAVFAFEKPIGFLEVGYLEDKSSEDKENFHAGEKRLFKNIAQRTGKIVERVQMEEALRKSEGKYRHLFENATVGMFRTRIDGSEILDMNQKFIDIFGYTRQEMLGAPAVIHWADPGEREEMIRILEKEGRVTEFECRMLTKQGQVRTCLTSLRIYREEGVLEGSIMDITEYKKIEAQMHHSQEIKLLGQIASGVAHEVRNPLNAILAITEALFKDIGPSTEYQPYLEHIRTQVTRLSNLMKDLLELGRPFQPEGFRDESLNEVLQATAFFWEETPFARTHRLALDIPEAGGELILKTDLIKLQHTFLNLLQNAAQNSPKGSTIQLRLAGNTPEWCKIQVIDQGTGIRSDFLNRVFDPFFTTRREGTGLGLSLVKGFVESMGGKVDLWNNDPPPGCTVELVLPIEGVSSLPVPEKTGSRLGSFKSTGKITGDIVSPLPVEKD